MRAIEVAVLFGLGGNLEAAMASEAKEIDHINRHQQIVVKELNSEEASNIVLPLNFLHSTPKSS